MAAAQSAFLATEGASEKPPLALRVANILALLGIFAANGAAGKNIGAVARRWNNHIKPDGWALSIWLVIYSLLIGFVVWQYRSATPRCSEIVTRIGWLFVASSACSAGWVLVYVQATPLSAVIAMLLMFALVACNVAICCKTAWRASDSHGRELTEVLVVDAAFSIYASWGESRQAVCRSPQIPGSSSLLINCPCVCWAQFVWPL